MDGRSRRERREGMKKNKDRRVKGGRGRKRDGVG